MSRGDQPDARTTPAARARGRPVLGAAAHEIKNALGPLAMTLQLAERQLRRGRRDRARRIWRFARAQVRRLSRWSSDLLDRPRADLGRLAFRPRPVDLRGRSSARRSRPSGAATRAHRVLTCRRRRWCTPSIGDAAGVRCCSTCSRTPPSTRPQRAPIAACGIRAWRPSARASRCTIAGRASPPTSSERIFDRFARGAAGRRDERPGPRPLPLPRHRRAARRPIGVDSTPGAGRDVLARLSRPAESATSSTGPRWTLAELRRLAVILDSSPTENDVGRAIRKSPPSPATSRARSTRRA